MTDSSTNDSAAAELIELLKRQQATTTEGFGEVRSELERMTSQLDALAAEVRSIKDGDSGSEAAANPSPHAPMVAPEEPVAPQPTSAVSAAASGDLDSLLFGPTLVANEALRPMRNELIRGAQTGVSISLSFAGTLLAFRGAAADRMAPLLKDIGEAYYAWQPNSAFAADPFRDALVAWLHASCQESGVANTIELVQPGDRFDAKRHSAAGRGVEVTNVHGWIVLRENGSVYTKASITVQ